MVVLCQGGHNFGMNKFKDLEGEGHFKRDWNEIWQECSSCKIRIDWWNQILDLTSHFQDGGHDITSCMKVLPPGQWTRSDSHAPI